MPTALTPVTALGSLVRLNTNEQHNNIRKQHQPVHPFDSDMAKNLGLNGMHTEIYIGVEAGNIKRRHQQDHAENRRVKQCAILVDAAHCGMEHALARIATLKGQQNNHGRQGCK
jgi:hypothetical protein